MKAQLMRSFAGGLLAATAIFGAVYFFGTSPSEAQTVEKPSTEELKSLLTAEGFVIHTEEEWNAQVAAMEAPKENEEEVTPETETETEAGNEQIVYRTVLSVSNGMTAGHIEEILTSSNIIDPSLDFSGEVENRGLSNQLKPGNYEVDSGMSVDDLIAAIFK